MKLLQDIFKIFERSQHVVYFITGIVFVKKFCSIKTAFGWFMLRWMNYDSLVSV